MQLPSLHHGNQDSFNFWKDKKSLLNFTIVVAFIILFFHLRYGLGMINPVETAWLMKYDWAQHYMGWYFFRNAPWTFPLGNMNNLFYPIGTNVGFTDSIPFVAILLKPLSSILPEQFQYFGPWLFLNHLLVAFFSIKLLNRFRIDGWPALLIVFLVTFNPMLMYRAMHTALASHWLIIANLWIYFLNPQEMGKYRILAYQLVLFIVGGLVNPYFVLINGGFLFILAIKLWYDKTLNLAGAGVYVVCCLGVLIAAWYVTGYVAPSGSAQLGITDAYGLPSWNLSSFFNPYNFDRFEDFHTNNLSSFLPAKPLVRWEQYESFSYLGLGLLVLSAIVIVLCLATAPARTSILNMLKRTDVKLLILLTIGLALFATSNIITYNDQVLFSFPLSARIKAFCDIFRASARYIWVAYYVWIFFLGLMLVSRLRKSWAIFALTAVAVIQFTDIRAMIFNQRLKFGPYEMPISRPHWESLIQSCDEVLFLPPLQSNYLTHDDWRYFSFLSARNRKPVSVGHVARIDFAASYQFAKKMLQQIQEGNLDSTAIYITRQDSYAQFLSNYFTNKVDIVTLDGYLVICPKNNKYPLQANALAKIKADFDQQFVTDHFKKASLSKCEPPPQVANNIKSSVYDFSVGPDAFVLRGWSFLENNPGVRDSTNVLLKGLDRTIFCGPASRFSTPDVADFFHNPALNQSGFMTTLSTESLENGRYQVGIEMFAMDEQGKIIQTHIQWIENYVDIVNSVKPTEIRWVDPTDKISSDINNLISTKDHIILVGWAFAEKKTARQDIFITLSHGPISKAYKTTLTKRPDVASFFDEPGLVNTGFLVKVKKLDLSPGTYSIGFAIYDHSLRKYLRTITDRTIEIGSTPSHNTQLIPGASLRAAVIFPPESDYIKGFADKVDNQKYFCKILGWGFLEGVDNKDSQPSILLISKTRNYVVQCERRARPDVKETFTKGVNIDSCGFEVTIDTRSFVKDEYYPFLMITNNGRVRYKPLNGVLKF